MNHTVVCRARYRHVRAAQKMVSLYRDRMPYPHPYREGRINHLIPIPTTISAILFHTHFLPAMSNNATWRLSSEEQILHHYAFDVKKDIEVYRASDPRDEMDWADKFRDHLVFHFPKIICYDPI